MRQQDDLGAPPRTAPLDIRNITRRPIALVDNEVDDQWALRRHLDFLFGKMSMITFYDSARLFSYLRDHGHDQHKPWLILINMTEKESLTTLDLLGANPDYADIPVYIISDEEDEEIIAQAFTKGARGFMPKPVRRGDVIEILNGREFRLLRDRPN